MALLTLAALKRHLVDPPIGDDELRTLLNAAFESIDQRIGAVGSHTETHRGTGRLLGLVRRAKEVTEIRQNGTVLDASTYRLRPSGEMVERTDGSVFRGTVDVDTLVEEDLSNRNRVAIGLVKLDLAYNPGISSETLGSYTESSSQQQGITYAQLREEYLASLESVPGFIK